MLLLRSISLSQAFASEAVFMHYCSIVLAESTINFVANKMFSVFLPVPAMST